MPSISALQNGNPSSLQISDGSFALDNRRPQKRSDSGGQMKIFGGAISAGPEPQDQVSVRKRSDPPPIRSLDPSRLPGSGYGPGIRSLGQNGESAVPIEKLATEYHFKALDLALARQGLKTEAHQQGSPIQQWVSQFRSTKLQAAPPIQRPETLQLQDFDLPLPEGGIERLRAALQTARQQPENLKLKARLQRRMEQTLTRLAKRGEQSHSPRIQRLTRLMTQGLEKLEKAATGEQSLSPLEQRQATTALAMMTAIEELSNGGSAPEQATRLQAWSLQVEDQVEQQGTLTARDLIDTAKQILSGVGSGLDPMQELRESLSLLGGAGDPDPPDPETLLDTPLSEAGKQILDLLKDMPPAELSQWAETMQWLSTEVQGNWQSDYLALDQALKQSVTHLVSTPPEDLGLSDDVLALIQRAEELAQKNLAPTPDLPRGFEEGVQSLFREFQRILRQLDRDQMVLFKKQFDLGLERLRLETHFLDQQQEAARYDSEVREQRSGLQKQLNLRLDRLQQALQDATTLT